MVQFILANGNSVKDNAKARLFLEIKVFMRDFGMKIIKLVSVESYFRMEIILKENFIKTK